MGQVVNGYLKLLKLLNKADSLSLDRAVLCTALDIDESALSNLISSINDNFSLLQLNEGVVSLKYRLDLLDDANIFKRADGAGRVVVLESVDSTNTYMLQNARNIASGDALLAEFQSDGRGRRGGKWHSGFGRQITLSVAYTFSHFEALRGLSIGIGVAVAQAVEKLGFENIHLKWPNDIYKDHLKIGGVLIETIASNGKVMAVIGVGLNVYPQCFENLDREYASIFDTDSAEFSRNDLAVYLINNIKRTCGDFEEGRINSYIQAFRSRDELLGRLIKVENEQGVYNGRAAGVDASGALILINEGGSISVSNGHITF